MNRSRRFRTMRRKLQAALCEPSLEPVKPWAWALTTRNEAFYMTGMKSFYIVDRAAMRAHKFDYILFKVLRKKGKGICSHN